MPPVDQIADTRARKIAAAVDDLEALPGAVTRALREMRNPRNTAREIAAIIERDQSLTANVLRYANSAALVGNRRIVSISEAIFRIGFAQLRSILMAVSTASVLERALVAYGLERGELWRHSYGAAVVARQIALHLRLPEPEGAYVGALLHDIGKVVLNRTIGRELAQPLHQALGETGELIQAEQRTLGFDHAYVGGLVIRRWGLPELLAEAIAGHHAPPETGFLAQLINLADQLTAYLEIGNSPSEPCRPIDAADLAFLGMVPKDLHQVLDSARQTLDGDNANGPSTPRPSPIGPPPIAAPPVVDAPAEVMAARQSTGRRVVELLASIW